jgi:hypothetical protein
MVVGSVFWGREWRALEGRGKVEGTCARPVGDVAVLRPMAVVNGWKFGVELMQRWEFGVGQVQVRTWT